MRILHTSDWHLGRALNRQQRYAEFAAFLDWLGETIERHQVEALLVAGDIFDTTTPGNRAQELYYRFLCRTAGSCCRNIIITAGNHDSPTFLEAPKELLRVMNIHVIGNPPDDPADEVILLYDRNNKPKAIVCSVPYLRDRDIRTSFPGESIEDKSLNLIDGIKKHYSLVAEIAVARQVELSDLPIIGMGHLFASGGTLTEGDGTRELYVGTLAHININELPDCFDYIALGHLHQAQKVQGSESRRYSGSPLPMSFAEAGRGKKVLLVEFNQKEPTISEIDVPCFQPLARITGDFSQIAAKIETLRNEKSQAWLEIEYTGKQIEGDLNRRLQELIEGTDLEIKITRDRSKIDQVMSRYEKEESLDDLTLDEVFRRCLDCNEIPEEQHPDLFQSYHEIITELQEEDTNAE